MPPNSAHRFFSAIDGESASWPATSATNWLETPQGVVHPSRAGQIAKQVGLSVDDVLAVARNKSILVGGKLVPSSANYDSDRRAGRALVAAGADPDAILWSLPLFEEPLVAVLANENLKSAQAALDRYYELNAPGSLVDDATETVQTTIEILVEHFTAGVAPWRRWWADEDGCPATLSPPQTSDLKCFIYETTPPPPNTPVQVMICDETRIAVFYPYVCIVLRVGDSNAIVDDAFRTLGHRAAWTIDGAIGFGPLLSARSQRSWLSQALPSAPRYTPYGEGRTRVFDADNKRWAPMSLFGSPGGCDVRATTADAAYCVLVRWLKPECSNIGLCSLIDVATGEPQTTKYDASLHRAKAIAFHDKTLHVAVNGQVISRGQRVATYPAKSATAFDVWGSHFAYADEQRLVLTETATRRVQTIDLRPLIPLLRPTSWLTGLSPLSEGIVLNGIGATPLTPQTLEMLKTQIEEGLFPTPSVDNLPLDEVFATRTATWPQLSVLRT